MIGVEKRPAPNDGADRRKACLPQGLLLLDGKLVQPLQPDRVIDVFDPATGDKIATIPACGAADVDRAVTSANRCFESSAWRSMRPLDRGRLLERLALLVEQHAIVAPMQQREHLFHRVHASRHVRHAGTDHVRLGKIAEIDLG